MNTSILSAIVTPLMIFATGGIPAQFISRALYGKFADRGSIGSIFAGSMALVTFLVLPSGETQLAQTLIILTFLGMTCLMIAHKKRVGASRLFSPSMELLLYAMIGLVAGILTSKGMLPVSF